MAGQRIVLRHQWPVYVSVLLPLWFFFAFFTQIKLIPGLQHNIGVFELIAIAVAGVFLVTEKPESYMSLDPMLMTALALTFLAAGSQLMLPASHRAYGLLQLAMLLFFVSFLFINHTLLRKYHLPVSWLAQIIIVSACFAGILVIIQGVETGGDIQAAGPFRNRAHMASYMLTAFWLCLVGLLWPGIRKPMRLVAIAAILLSLYCIAVSGRRSVYLALFLGLAGLIGGVATARRGKRLQWIGATVLAIGFLAGVYVGGAKTTGRASFFHDRVGMIEGRVNSFLGRDEALSPQRTFFSLQREGVLLAFRTSPIVGIGWGGFPASRYSPTGHEVHSTPLRFLAELGIMGLALYVFFMVSLLVRSLRLYTRMRASPYSNSYLALAVGVWSMSLSYVYNRHITERTFWILLAVFMAMDVFASDWHALRRRFAASTPETGDSPARARPLAVGG